MHQADADLASSVLHGQNQEACVERARRFLRYLERRRPIPCRCLQVHDSARSWKPDKFCARPSRLALVEVSVASSCGNRVRAFLKGGSLPSVVLFVLTVALFLNRRWFWGSVSLLVTLLSALAYL